MPAAKQPSSLPDEGIIKQPGIASDFQLTAVSLKTPFGKIALALSGGGFRAASYSLGAMSYLHYLKYPDGTDDKRVLDNVAFISSASGGTFTGMLYSMHVQQGKRFEDTYASLIKFMNGQGLLEQVLELINDDSKWTEGKSRNFINAFARIYNDDLFDKKTFDVYWSKKDYSPDRRMEVCFNTTEFFRGLSFRFQAGDYSGKAGNEYLFFDKKDEAAIQTLRQIKLGDILAASSCFPAGFEPILFPKDFVYQDDKTALTEEDLRKALTINDYNNSRLDYQKDVGLMDGGIDDNQGVYSAMVADTRQRRNNADNGFDLVFVTDVASYFMHPYVAPAAKTEGINKDSLCSVAALCQKKIRKVRNIINGAAIVSAILLSLSLYFIFAEPARLSYNIVLIVAAVSATLLVVDLLIKKYVLGMPLLRKFQAYLGMSDNETGELIKGQVPSLRNFSNSALNLLVHHLKNSPLGILQQMLKARVNSMLSLVLDINLKQTRRLIFDIFYGNFYGGDIWDNRRVFNVIYELSAFNMQNRLSVLEKSFNKEKYQLSAVQNTDDSWAKDCISTLTSNCDGLQTVAETARNMGTTLWFDKEDADTQKMMAVVACGQFTTCVKLLEYAMKVERQLEIQEQTPGTAKKIDFNPEQLTLFKSVKKQLEADWAAFKTNPDFLVKLYNTSNVN